jgi:hypothetical protein
MNCPRANCGAPAQIDAEDFGPYSTKRRAYVCASHHRFTTVEVYEPQGTNIERNLLMKALRAIQLKFFARGAHA